MPSQETVPPPHPKGSTPAIHHQPTVVGVFDSGVGGLSVLPALRQALPTAMLVYVADSGFAPYGERAEAWLIERCALMAGFLKQRGAHLMVMACNTATAAAVPTLRASYPDWPIVGIEPGVKPAVLSSRSGRIGVMATQATLRSARFERLLQGHGRDAHVVTLACTGLAMAIELGDQAQIESLVVKYTRVLRAEGVDTVVLGCTHYPFARPWIEEAMGPAVSIIDTSDAVARRAAALAWDAAPDVDEREAASLPRDRSDPMPAEFWTSGQPEALERFALRWLNWRIKAQRLPLLPAEPEPDSAAPDR